MPNNQVISYLDATGEIPYSLTNDYMFHVVLQENETILRGFLIALLHLPPDTITKIAINNPITPGKHINDKEFILDLKLNINNNALINIEMQVINQKNWPERSLAYLCRTYDQLHQNEDYSISKPAIHIGILDFQPFENNLEFYATYQLLNIKNYHLYSGKFILNVLDLTHINLATEEDQKHEIDRWAQLFKATTWEELKMIAANNESMNTAAQLLYEYNADAEIRDQCYARAERLKKERYHAQLEKEHQALEAAYQQLENSYQKQVALLSEKDSALSEKDIALSEKDIALSEKDAEIARLKALLSEKQ